MNKFVLAAFAATLSLPAFAQVVTPSSSPAPNVMTQSGPSAGEKHKPAGPDAMACAIHNGATAKFLKRTHDKLKITSGQEADWKSFAETVTTAVGPLGDDCGKEMPQFQSMSLTQRLSTMEAHERAHADALTKVSSAVSTMYGKLTPDQQKIADQLPIPHPMKDHHADAPHGNPGHLNTRPMPLMGGAPSTDSAPSVNH